MTHTTSCRKVRGKCKHEIPGMGARRICLDAGGRSDLDRKPCRFKWPLVECHPHLVEEYDNHTRLLIETPLGWAPKHECKAGTVAAVA